MQYINLAFVIVTSVLGLYFNYRTMKYNQMIYELTREANKSSCK